MFSLFFTVHAVVEHVFRYDECHFYREDDDDNYGDHNHNHDCMEM